MSIVMVPQEYKLDNPVWHSLNEVHEPFTIAYDGVKFYHPAYCPFGGFTEVAKVLEALHQYARLIDNFYVVGQQPLLSNSLVLKNELVCRQMLLKAPSRVNTTEDIVDLQPIHYSELFNLVNLVQPGYFKEKTPLMGRYFGIFKNEKLVSVTGERMQMQAYTEVSAVVTHPEHTGKGYAKQLVAHTVSKIFSANKIPYLHVTDTNTNAIALYEKLGFITRRQISFWNIGRITPATSH